MSPSAPPPPEGANPLTPLAISLSEVEHRYPDGTPALRGVNLDVPEGEHVALVGPNGAGKSTLVRHLNGILLATGGEVRVFGKKVQRSTLDEVRQTVGVVFQDPEDQLFSPTVREDVAFGPRNQGLDAVEVDRRVAFALDLMDMTGDAGRPAHHLSFGQKKRAAVASVLSMLPRIWVFDEPSSNLDPQGQAALETFLKGREETMLIVTQDLLFAAETCGRMVILEAGKVQVDRPILDLLRDPDLLERHGLDFERYCRLCRKLHADK